MNDAGYVLFRLGERVFATALDGVREIVRLRGLQALPGTRPPLAGIITLRGAPLPVLDVRGPRPSDHGEADEGGDVLVVTGSGDPVGVAVDAVVAVVRPEELPESAIPPASALPGYVVRVRTGAAGPVLEVDVHRLLDATANGWDGALAAVS